MKAKERVFGLDALRALAISLVVLAHYFASTPLRFGGTIGVELFFVLSGFLIGGILIKTFQRHGANFKSLRNFWVRRWYRTLPNYFFFLLVFSGMAWTTGEKVGLTWTLYLPFLQNFFWPVSGFFEISWSLAVEEWFYLLFPFALWFFCRRSGVNRWSVILATSIFLIFPIILRVLMVSIWDTDSMRKVVLLRLDSMMYGVAVATLRIYRPEAWKSLGQNFVFLGSIIFGILGCVWFERGDTMAKIFALSLISLSVAMGLPWLENLNPKWRASDIVATYVSKVSYSTYLLHMPLFFAADLLFSPYPSAAWKFGERVLLLIVTFLLSFLTYRLVELPFLKLRDRFAPESGSQIVKQALA